MKVLVVDDDLTVVEVIRDSVHWDSLGVEKVFIALNVSSAKQILQEENVDIIISDIEMPQESGLDLLRWLRTTEMECEFLLLTCHESFTFATEAINSQAAAYLTKPFDLNLMEMNLQKITSKIKEQRLLAQNSDFGIKMQQNKRFMKLDFWKFILSNTVIDEALVRRELLKRQLEISVDHRYFLIITKFNNLSEDIEKYGKDIVEFILEGFHSELITGFVSNERVIRYQGDGLRFVCVCDEKDFDLATEQCKQLQVTCKTYFASTSTICISDAYKITELYKAQQGIIDLLEYHVAFYGKIFHEHSVEKTYAIEERILDADKMKKMLLDKEKGQILHYVKQVFHELMHYNKLNAHSLYLIKQEIIQMIYGYLAQLDIQVTQLFKDDLSIRLSEEAGNSMVDMIRWLNHFLEQTYEIEEKNSQAMTLVEKINVYIHQHYAEEIDRNQLAEIFFLSPEYLAKQYKKKTGENLIDYINNYRIEQAKELLRTTDLKISEVSVQVGFNNFSYFSTLFKKITGETPKNYKSTCL